MVLIKTLQKRSHLLIIDTVGPLPKSKNNQIKKQFCGEQTRDASYHQTQNNWYQFCAAAKKKLLKEARHHVHEQELD